MLQSGSFKSLIKKPPPPPLPKQQYISCLINQYDVSVSDPPPAILQPQNVSVLPGNTAILSCIAYSTVEFNLTWVRASDGYDLSRLNRAMVYTNGSVEIR